MYATKGDDNYFFPVNMQIGIKRCNKTKKRTLPHCLYLIITFMFVNMTKIYGNFSPSLNGISYQNAIIR